MKTDKADMKVMKLNEKAMPTMHQTDNQSESPLARIMVERFNCTRILWVTQIQRDLQWKDNHCAKSVQIQIFFWLVFSLIQSKYGKKRTRKNSVFGVFPCSEYKGPLQSRNN